MLAKEAKKMVPRSPTSGPLAESVKRLSRNDDSKARLSSTSRIAAYYQDPLTFVIRRENPFTSYD
jgi:hypothetical protein